MKEYRMTNLEFFGIFLHGEILYIYTNISIFRDSNDF